MKSAEIALGGIVYSEQLAHRPCRYSGEINMRTLQLARTRIILVAQEIVGRPYESCDSYSI